MHLIPFKYFMTEGKVLDANTNLIHEPTNDQLHHIIDKSPYKEARALYHPKHGLFAWDAESRIHHEIRDKLNKDRGSDMKFDDTHRLLIARHKETKELFVRHMKEGESYNGDGSAPTVVNHRLIKKLRHAASRSEYERNKE